MKGKKVIKITGAAPLKVPLSLAVSFDSLLFMSGQVSIDLKTGKPKLGTIEEETEQALKNIETILKEASSSIECVLKTTVFLTNIKEIWYLIKIFY